MTTYKCSKKTIMFWLFAEALIVWLAIDNYFQQNYTDMFIGTALILTAPFWIYSLCRLKIVVNFLMTSRKSTR